MNIIFYTALVLGVVAIPIEIVNICNGEDVGWNIGLLAGSSAGVIVAVIYFTIKKKIEVVKTKEVERVEDGKLKELVKILNGIKTAICCNIKKKEEWQFVGEYHKAYLSSNYKAVYTEEISKSVIFYYELRYTHRLSKREDIYIIKERIEVEIQSEQHEKGAEKEFIDKVYSDILGLLIMAETVVDSIRTAEGNRIEIYSGKDLMRENIKGIKNKEI